jgi:arginine/lysine/ornithine decarboxylase
MGTVRPGEALLLARNCHLSAFSACVLSDAVPVWLQPEQDPMHGIAHCVTPEQLQQGFRAAKQQALTVGAVLVVSPTYYGAVARIPGALAAAGGAFSLTHRQHAASTVANALLHERSAFYAC